MRLANFILGILAIFTGAWFIFSPASYYFVTAIIISIFFVFWGIENLVTIITYRKEFFDKEKGSPVKAVFGIILGVLAIILGCSSAFTRATADVLVIFAAVGLIVFLIFDCVLNFSLFFGESRAKGMCLVMAIVEIILIVVLSSCWFAIPVAKAILVGIGIIALGIRSIVAAFSKDKVVLIF